MVRQCTVWCSSSLFALTIFTYPLVAQAPPPPAGDVGAEELTRGPVHEAFGQPVAFNPTSGIIAPKAPPAPVEELPPDEKPEGDRVAWISGYWAWDDEAKNFLWVSGLWRNIPPGRTWVAGYWNETTEGVQWVSGYWVAEATTEVTYLPPPPETLEAGPVGAPPTVESVWAPGCWIWRETRYLWQPGHYITGYADWVWTPSHYEWSPAGYVFVNGFWDYPLETRGLLFAPVSFARYRPGFQYIPQVVIDTRYLSLALFARPAYSHYYFGDYYASNYVSGGIYPWFAFHSSRYGYDPLYEHMDYVSSRRDPRWETNMRQVYFQRRDNEALRPARTFRGQAEAVRRADAGTAASLALAQPLSQARQKDFPVNVVKVNQTNITNIRNNVKVVNESRTERVKVEKQVVKDHGAGGSTGGKQPATARAPVNVKVNATANLVAPAAKGSRPAARAPEAPTAPKPSDTAPATRPAAKGRLHDPEEALKPDFQRPGARNRDVAPKGKDREPLPKTGSAPKKEPVEEPPVNKKPPKTDPVPKKDREDDPPAKTPVPKPVEPPPQPKVTPPMPPAKVDPPKAEPPKAAPPKAEPPKAEPPKATPPKANPPKGKDKDKD